VAGKEGGKEREKKGKEGKEREGDEQTCEYLNGCAPTFEPWLATPL